MAGADGADGTLTEFLRNHLDIIITNNVAAATAPM